MIGRATLFTLALIGAAYAGRALVLPETNLAMFWPAGGVAALWALVARSRRELVLVTVVIAAVMAVTYGLAGFTLLGVALTVVANEICGVGVRLGVDVVRGARPGRTPPPPPALRTPRDVNRFIAVSLIAVAISAFFAIGAVFANGDPGSWTAVVANGFRNLAGVLLIAGTGLVFMRGESRQRIRWGQAFGAAASTLVLTAIIFTLGHNLPLAHALLLPLFWSGINTSPRFATAHACWTAAVTVAFVFIFGGYAFGSDLTDTALATRVQLLVVNSAIVSLVVSTAMANSRGLTDSIKHRALHDPLTGLLNRAGFDQELARAHQRLETEGRDSGLLLFDLDNFKNVNDTLGHAVGDRLLIAIAGALRAQLRPTDMLARLGGDEFTLLLPDTDRIGAARVAQLTLERVREVTSRLDGEQRRVTASVGVITLDAARRAETDALVMVDMLMYDAKEDGRNTYAVIDPEGFVKPRSATRLDTMQRIETALDDGKFELHLQPIVDLRRGVVRGAEALIRLRDGDNVILPGDFMQVAEQTGLSSRIDGWVVGEALRILDELAHLAPDFTLAANVSGPSVGNPQFEQILRERLRQHPPAPGCFILEVTETAAVGDMRRAQRLAEELRRRGIGLSLDDFGSGFASFAYLKNLDFDYIKIDGQFVADIVDSPVDRSIVRSLVGLAQDLGKRTVAEYVGCERTLDCVRQLNVDFAQGFGIGKAIPVDEFVQTHLSRAPMTIDLHPDPA